MIRRLLVGLGAPDYVPAEIQCAVELADRYRAELTGVSVVDTGQLEYLGSVPLGAAESARQLREQRRAEAHRHVEHALAQFESACRAASIRYRIRRDEQASALDVLVDEARYHDLIVCGLRGIFETGRTDDESGGAATDLARMVSGGVRPIIAVARQHRPVHRVLIAYSGSMESAKTMKQFIQFEPWLGAVVRIVVFNHTEDVAARLLGEAELYCRAHGIAAEVAHVPGNPRDQILPVASDWGADLIVLGNSAKNLLVRRVLGETALHVMQTADRPLFLSQ